MYFPIGWQFSIWLPYLIPGRQNVWFGRQMNKRLIFIVSNFLHFCWLRSLFFTHFYVFFIQFYSYLVFCFIWDVRIISFHVWSIRFFLSFFIPYFSCAKRPFLCNRHENDIKTVGYQNHMLKKLVLILSLVLKLIRIYWFKYSLWLKISQGFGQC